MHKLNTNHFLDLDVAEGSPFIPLSVFLYTVKGEEMLRLPHSRNHPTTATSPPTASRPLQSRSQTYKYIKETQQRVFAELFELENSFPQTPKQTKKLSLSKYLS